jgi:hypothetical protein
MASRWRGFKRLGLRHRCLGYRRLCGGEVYQCWRHSEYQQYRPLGRLTLAGAGPAASDLFAYWYRDGVFEYTRFAGSSWDPSPTTLIDASLASYLASCDGMSGGGLIKCLSTTGASSPYTLRIDTQVP